MAMMCLYCITVPEVPFQNGVMGLLPSFYKSRSEKPTALSILAAREQNNNFAVFYINVLSVNICVQIGYLHTEKSKAFGCEKKI